MIASNYWLLVIISVIFPFRLLLIIPSRTFTANCYFLKLPSPYIKMSKVRLIQSSAPGKVILHGEYAVVFGKVSVFDKFVEL